MHCLYTDVSDCIKVPTRDIVMINNWSSDIAFLQSDKYKISTLKVFTQALIHSNLFDCYVSKHNKLKTLTLAEMVEKSYKKPFVCFIDEEKGMHFSIYNLWKNTLSHYHVM